MDHKLIMTDLRTNLCTEHTHLTYFMDHKLIMTVYTYIETKLQYNFHISTQANHHNTAPQKHGT
jgi:hypothetical protein